MSKSNFLSERLGSNVRIDLGKSDEGVDYYVEIRPLTKGAQAECQKRLSRLAVSFDAGGRRATPSGELNVQDYQEEVVVRSIVSWNITGEEGVLPFNPIDECRKSYRRLPSTVADQIFEECDKLNSPPSEEDNRRFRGDGDSSAEGSEAQDTSTGNGRVPDGEGTLAELGA